jgi:monoamine oxidase
MGGLAAAISLAGAGRAVVLLEAAPTLGGKAGTATVDGVTFDTGPSVLTLPRGIQELFAAAGAENRRMVRTGAPMKVYVGNLSKQITDAQLNELATPYGTLVSANVATERASGASRGFGFLEYGTDDEARAAITGLDGRDVEGQALKVNEAKPKKDAEVVQV